MNPFFFCLNMYIFLNSGEILIFHGPRYAYVYFMFLVTLHSHTHTHTDIYIYIYIYVCGGNMLI